MSSFLLKNKTKNSFLEGIQTLQYSTRENYNSSLNQFEKFCKNSYDNRTTQQILDELEPHILSTFERLDFLLDDFLLDELEPHILSTFERLDFLLDDFLLDELLPPSNQSTFELVFGFLPDDLLELPLNQPTLLDDFCLVDFFLDGLLILLEPQRDSALEKLFGFLPDDFLVVFVGLLELELKRLANLGLHFDALHNLDLLYLSGKMRLCSE